MGCNHPMVSELELDLNFPTPSAVFAELGSCLGTVPTYPGHLSSHFSPGQGSRTLHSESGHHPEPARILPSMGGSGDPAKERNATPLMPTAPSSQLPLVVRDDSLERCWEAAAFRNKFIFLGSAAFVASRSSACLFLVPGGGCRSLASLAVSCITPSPASIVTCSPYASVSSHGCLPLS